MCKLYKLKRMPFHHLKRCTIVLAHLNISFLLAYIFSLNPLLCISRLFQTLASTSLNSILSLQISPFFYLSLSLICLPNSHRWINTCSFPAQFLLSPSNFSSSREKEHMNCDKPYKGMWRQTKRERDRPLTSPM